MDAIESGIVKLSAGRIDPYQRTYAGRAARPSPRQVNLEEAVPAAGLVVNAANVVVVRFGERPQFVDQIPKIAKAA